MNDRQRAERYIDHIDPEDLQKEATHTDSFTPFRDTNIGGFPQRKAHITFLFLCVQFGGHFLDIMHALNTTASLFRSTETHSNKMK